MDLVQLFLKIIDHFGLSTNMEDYGQLREQGEDWAKSCNTSSKDQLKATYAKIFHTNPWGRFALAIGYFFIVKELSTVLNGSSSDDREFQ